MSRKTKTKTKPLTAKQLADMDYKHETKKAAAIKDRGVTAAVTGPTKAEIAAYELLGKSPHFMVGMADTVNASMKRVYSLGQLAGKVEGFQDGFASPRSAGEQRVLDQTPALRNVLQEVFVEARKAIKGHASMHSPHEGLGVIFEEYDELVDEIKADRGRQASARKEAIQLAAMGVRYVLDLNPR